MDFAAACQHTFDLDQRLCYGADYSIDLQATRNQAQRSGARLGPLITNVNPQVFQRPTFRLFLSLLDNYERKTGTAETASKEELWEQSQFLDAIMVAPCMQFVHQWLAGRQVVGGSPEAFKAALTKMWFSLYRREVQNDSSGFEHVFLGESDRGVVKGLHSWIQFYLEEQKGNLYYQGYLEPRGRSGTRAHAEASDAVLSVHFEWLRESKAVSSIVLGSTPEFEIALYTLCFLGGTEENFVSLGPYELKIRAYRIRSKYGDKIGTVFPELLSKGEHTRPAPIPGQAVGNGRPQHHPPLQQTAYPGPPYQPQSGSYAAAAYAGQHVNPTPSNFSGQQPYASQQQQPYYGGQSQAPNQDQDTVSQGCSLLGAVLRLFCGGQGKSRQ